MKELRIFPRKTNATPDDNDVIINKYPDLFSSADNIKISVAFSYDMKIAENLYNQWKYVAPIEMGGPAFNDPEGEFTPGRFIKTGYVITSRGCPNRCWFCNVWKRQPEIKELKINEGWNILDDNLLACSDEHIINVFNMLKKQSKKARFTGGLEPKRLKKWHCELLAEIKPEFMYFAYDTPDDYYHLVCASELLSEYNLMVGHRCMCYVLIGYPGDTFKMAQDRITKTIKLGYMPFAMLYRDKQGIYNIEWKQFQRQYANPIITAINMTKILK